MGERSLFVLKEMKQAKYDQIKKDVETEVWRLGMSTRDTVTFLQKWEWELLCYLERTGEKLVD